jgi:hypothetical protein
MGSIVSKSFLTDRLLRDSPQKANNIDQPPTAAVPPTPSMALDGRLKKLDFNICAMPNLCLDWIRFVQTHRISNTLCHKYSGKYEKKGYIPNLFFFSVFVPFIPSQSMAAMPFPTLSESSSSYKDIVARQMMPMPTTSFLSSLVSSTLSATASAFMPNNNQIAQRHAMQMFYNNRQLTFSGDE